MNWIGDKFDSLGEDRYNLAVICSHIRSDLKAEFSKPWKFSVSKDHYSSITISIYNAPKEALNNPESRYFDELFNDEYRHKLYDIANAYNYDDSDGQSDYFDRNYYVHFNVNNFS